MWGANTVVGADLAYQSLYITLTIEQAIRIYFTSKGTQALRMQDHPKICLPIERCQGDIQERC